MFRRRRVWGAFFLFAFFALFVCFVDSNLTPAAAQEASPTPSVVAEMPTVGPVSVSYPLHGQTLKGSVVIRGSIALDGWTSYELAFSYAENATPNWFIFASGTNPAPGGLLVAWDTTTLTDSDYNLRLRVFSPGGAQDVFIYGLRVRNYALDTPVPTIVLTSTPSPTASPSITLVPTSTPAPSATPYFTPTPLPPNPATLRPGEIVFNLGRGVLFTALLFGVFGLFLRMRAKGK